MGLVIEFKNMGLFFKRRLKLIILATILVLGGYVAFNTFTQKEVVNTAPQSSYSGDKYISYFKIYVENPATGGAVMNVSTIYKMLTQQLILDELEKKTGIEIKPEELFKIIKVSSKETEGEVLTVRVFHENQTFTDKATQFFYNKLKNNSIDFFSDKKVLLIAEPTDSILSSGAEYPKDVTSSAGTVSAPAASVVAKTNNPSQYVLVAFIGVILGVFVGLIADILDKKIHNINTIYTLITSEVKVIDLIGQSVETGLTKLAIATMSSGSNVIYLSENKLEGILNKIESELINNSMETNRLIYGDTIKINDALVAEKVFLFCQKDKTSIKWLKEQFELAVLTGKNVEVVYYKEG